MGRERRAARIRRHGNAGMIPDAWCRTLKKNVHTRMCPSRPSTISIARIMARMYHEY